MQNVACEIEKVNEGHGQNEIAELFVSEKLMPF